MRVSERGELTTWRWNEEELVRIQKVSNPAGGTDFLEIAEGGTGHNTYAKSLSEGNSLAGDGRGRVLSDHGKNPTEQGHQGVLTFWIWQREGVIRIFEQTD